MKQLKPLWSSESTTGSDLTFHQISPYIGRVKTTIARFLIENRTHEGDLVVDPFCGSGVIALEAAARGRKVIAGDWNPYAALLTRAKMFAPKDLKTAERQLHEIWERSRELLHEQDLRSVPRWVRKFFHPETLRSTLAFRDACVEQKDDFLLACLLGILHHQRPGFLSFPSSHLVPYLIDRNYPRKQYPEMYKERDVLSRLEKKIKRTYLRPPNKYTESRRVFLSDARTLPTVSGINAVITSPPYMNKLDYMRDNRLRIWFINRSFEEKKELNGSNRLEAFKQLLRVVCIRLAPNIVKNGYFILVVGDVLRGSKYTDRTAKITRQLFDTETKLSSFKLDEIYNDKIPDIRRSRRDCKGTKTETVLIYNKIR